MNHERSEPQEFIGYRRAAALPGIEVLDAHHSPRDWRCVNESFALTFLRTWHGDVVYRGVKHAARPGLIVCNQAGEALLALPHAGRAGSFNVLGLRSELFKEYVFSHQFRAGRPDHFKRIIGVTPKQYQLARGTNQEERVASGWQGAVALVDRSDWRVH